MPPPQPLRVPATATKPALILPAGSSSSSSSKAPLPPKKSGVTFSPVPGLTTAAPQAADKDFSKKQVLDIVSADVDIPRYVREVIYTHHDPEKCVLAVRESAKLANDYRQTHNNLRVSQEINRTKTAENDKERALRVARKTAYSSRSSSETSDRGCAP